MRLKIDYKMLRSTETKKNAITLLVQQTNKILYLLSSLYFLNTTKEILKKSQKPQEKGFEILATPPPPQFLVCWFGVFFGEKQEFKIMLKFTFPSMLY